MKLTVLDNSNGRLVVRSAPWAIWTWLTRAAAVAGALIWLAGAAELFHRWSIECDRASARCTATDTTVFGSEARSFAPSTLEGAELVTTIRNWESNGGEIILRTAGESIVALRFDEGQASDAKAAVNDVNDFVRDATRPRLEVTIYNPAIVMFLVFFGGGIFLVAWWGRVTTVMLDRLAGTFAITTSLVFPFTRRGTLQSIATVEIRKPGRKSLYSVVLVLTDGRCRLVDKTNDLKEANDVLGVIQRFLAGAALPATGDIPDRMPTTEEMLADD